MSCDVSNNIGKSSFQFRDFIASIILFVVRFAYPCYLSKLAFVKNDEKKKIKCISFWITIAIVFMFEYMFHIKGSHLFLTRFLFSLWLQIPFLDGCLIIFKAIIFIIEMFGQKLPEKFVHEIKLTPFFQLQFNFKQIYSDILLTLPQPDKDEDSSPLAGPNDDNLPVQ